MADARDTPAPHDLGVGYRDRLHDRGMAFIQFQKDYGANVIRSLFLLNGGAAVAILALIGALFGKDGHKAELVATMLFRGARPALVSFGMGLVAAVVSGMLAWLNFNEQLRYLSPNELLDLAKGIEPKATWRRPAVIWGTFILSPCCCVAATFAFIRGGMFISHAMVLATAAIIP